MSGSDGNLGSVPGKSSWFTTTHWSVVLAAGQISSPNAEEALEELCRTYWFPLYAYVRRKGYSPEDAQDLTQACKRAFGKTENSVPTSTAPGLFCRAGEFATSTAGILRTVKVACFF